MWAVARYDFGLTDEEFGKLTPTQFQLLWERRTANFRRQCYLHGITAAATYNVQRTDWKQETLSPMDFIPRSQAETEREAIVSFLTKLKGTMPASKLSEAKQSYLLDLKQKGRADAEGIIAEVFGEK